MTSLLSPAARPAADPTPARGLVARFAHSAALRAQRRPKTVIAAWLLLVVICLASGAFVGSRSLTDVDSGVGDSGRADSLLQQAGLRQPATESLLVTAATAEETRAAVDDLTRGLRGLPQVAEVTGPAQSSRLVTDDGRTALVQARLGGDPDEADAQPLLDLGAQVQGEHPGSLVQEAGATSESTAIDDVVAHDLQRAELISLPITLLILLLAFGAVVAACVPLVLGITAVAAATGALALVSQVAPNSDSTSAVVVLIGLAVGVDYSLFYVRREREERRRGRGPARVSGRATPDSALAAAASSVGRAILVSGLTVVVALAGLLVSGAADPVSIGLGTIVVVVLAVLGSLTVLPAMLALLDDRVDRGRVPGLRALGAARERRQARLGRRTGVWAGIARVVTRRPRAWAVAAACVLGALAIPALGMHTGDPQVSDLPQDLPVVRALHAIEASFPGGADDVELVVQVDHLDSAAGRDGLGALGGRALVTTGGQGRVSTVVSSDGRVARLDVPMPNLSDDQAEDTVRRLRDDVAATASEISGVSTPALVTGDAASSLDYAHQMSRATPEVIGFVLVLGFLVLLLTFRAPLLAAAVMGLNLLSVLAAYGILTACFQHAWSEQLLGLHSASPRIVDWLPMLMFVILFGLSMDYTVLVLERIREARLAGMSPRAAAAEGVAATAGTVTSAAVVMVAVFSIFATFDVVTFKQLGVGLAAAVLLDATLVRGVALPAVVAVLGRRGWPVRRCEDAQVARAADPTLAGGAR